MLWIQGLHIDSNIVICALLYSSWFVLLLSFISVMSSVDVFEIDTDDQYGTIPREAMDSVGKENHQR